MLNYIKLNKGETWRPRTAPIPRGRPRVIAGQAWLTARGCLKDYILDAGEAFPSCEDEWVVESLSSELTIEIPLT